jgi:hypothetical protein
MSYDVGEFIGKSIDDYTKQQLLLNHWKPPNNYEFPYSKHNKIYKNKIKDMQVKNIWTNLIFLNIDGFSPIHQNY